MGCIWFDVCWCYVAVWLWWCGIGMQAEALLKPKTLLSRVCMLNLTHRFQRNVDILCGSQVLVVWFLTYVNYTTNVKI